MRDLIRRVRDELISTEDTVCLQRAWLVTEAYRRYEDDPPPLKRAKAFAHVLGNMDLDLSSNPVFAGNTSSRPRAWMLIPEHGITNDTQVLIENEGLDHILDGRIPQEILDYWKDKSFGGAAGIGHLAVDMDTVVHRGLESLIAEAERHNSGETDPERRIYREAMIISLQAVIDWAHRYAKAAEEAARSERDDVIRELLLRVARACRHVPAKPARDLFEALQAMALVHLAVAIEGHGMSISIGLPDRTLAPFIDDRFDAEQATDLIAAFLLKIAANSFLGRGSKTQAITVGGANHLGEDQSNAITSCFLDAFDLLRIGDPHLFLRWHEGLDEKVKRRAAGMIASGISMPQFINDRPTVEGFINLGVSEEDAWDYCVIGCNELGIPGRLMSTATATIGGTIQYLELLNETLFNFPEPDSIRDMSQLLVHLEERMRRRAVEMRRRGLNRWRRMAERVPTPFTSSLMHGCIERGRDLLLGMKYWFPGYYERGLTNAINALAAIERTVFQERSISLGDLIRAMRENFPDERIRQLLLAGPKWGEDDERVDRWASVLTGMRERVLKEVDAQFGHPTHTVCHVVRSLHYVDGRRIAASPDGRPAWTPVADSIGAEMGIGRNGPTAILKSVLKLDYPGCYRGGYNLNLTLPKSEAKPEVLLPLIEGFFTRGGQELQINCFDAEMLREAQKEPEKYRDLVVRVAGFCTRFIDLSRKEQEELIRRAEALETCR